MLLAVKADISETCRQSWVPNFSLQRWTHIPVWGKNSNARQWSQISCDIIKKKEKGIKKTLINSFSLKLSSSPTTPSWDLTCIHHPLTLTVGAHRKLFYFCSGHLFAVTWVHFGGCLLPLLEAQLQSFIHWSFCIAKYSAFMTKDSIG